MMQQSKTTLTGLDTLRWLANNGAHFCQVARWDDPDSISPGKAPISKGWQKSPLTADQVTAHINSGGNAGLLTGKYSGDAAAGHIVILDADEDFSSFCGFFGWPLTAPTIVRAGADKGKVLIRVLDPLPENKTFKLNPTDKQPFFEFLATGRQGVVIGKHPTGVEYRLIHAENGIPCFTAAGVNAICEAWTGRSLKEFESHRAAERKTQTETTRDNGGDGLLENVLAAWPNLKIFEHFNRAGEIRTKRDEQKLGGNGGLFVNGDKWYCFSDDCGGGPFQAWQYCKNGTTSTPSGRGFYDLLCEMAIEAGISIPEHMTSPTIPPEPETPPVEGLTETTPVKTFADMVGMIGPVEWAWKPWLPKGMLVILAGESGAGKSGLALRLAGCFLRGDPWPDGQPFTGERGAVLWGEAEAAQAVNLDRAKAWGLPLDQLYTPLSNPLDDLKLDQEGHRAMLAQKAALPEVKLIVIDSLRGVLGRGDENASETLNFIKWLAELARDTGKCLVLSHHLRKRSIFDGEGVELERLRGSSAIVQTARVVWALDVPDVAEKANKRLSVIKSNLAKFPDPVGMTIDETGVRFGAAPEAPRPETRADQAIDLLLNLLQGGPRPANEIEQEFNDAGISIATLKRGKAKLGVVSIKDRTGWKWSLPAKDQQDRLLQ